MKKILIILVLVGAVAGGYCLWDKRYEYFFTGEVETKPEQADAPESSDNANPTDTPTDQQSTGDDQQPADSDVKITDYDCSQSCENRKNSSTYEYCRELCGFNESLEQAQPDNIDCDALENFNKDVCLKRKAVKEKKDNICDGIEDAQMKESCINRVAEEILE